MRMPIRPWHMSSWLICRSCGTSNHAHPDSNVGQAEPENFIAALVAAPQNDHSCAACPGFSRGFGG
jgi:hypothetical protein